MGDFKAIDHIDIPDLFKWKVAFLYSNERLVPIFQREALHKIASHFGMEVTGDVKVSDIQDLMIREKPATKDIYAYMRELYGRFSKPGKEEKRSNKDKPKKGRKAIERKETGPQERTITGRTLIAEQRHNIIQNRLKDLLIAEYGEAAVVPMEHNYVDLKLEQPTYINFYEVKSDPYALACVRQALGQLLYYVFADDDARQKNLIIVGQNEPSENERRYIDYIKSVVKIPFEYIAVNISTVI